MSRQPKKPRTAEATCPRCRQKVVRQRRNGKWVWRHLIISKVNANCFFTAEGKHWDETWT